MVKNGTGTWVLTNENTYTGPTVVNAGRLQIANPNGIMNSLGLTVNNGGAFHFTPGTGADALVLAPMTGTALTLATGSRVGLELRYTHGLTNVWSDDGRLPSHNQVWTFAVSWLH